MSCGVCVCPSREEQLSYFCPTCRRSIMQWCRIIRGLKIDPNPQIEQTTYYFAFPLKRRCMKNRNLKLSIQRVQTIRVEALGELAWNVCASCLVITSNSKPILACGLSQPTASTKQTSAAAATR